MNDDNKTNGPSYTKLGALGRPVQWLPEHRFLLFSTSPISLRIEKALVAVIYLFLCAIFSVHVAIFSRSAKCVLLISSL